MIKNKQVASVDFGISLVICFGDDRLIGDLYFNLYSLKKRLT